MLWILDPDLREVLKTKQTACAFQENNPFYLNGEHALTIFENYLKPQFNRFGRFEYDSGLIFDYEKSH